MALLGVEHGERAVPQRLEARLEADDQRRAAGARQQGDVAGGAAAFGRGADVVLPVDLQEARGGQLLVGVDRRLPAAIGRHVGGRRQRPRDPIAQIDEVGRARPKGVVVGRPVVGDLAIQGAWPRPYPPAARRARASRIGSIRSSSSSRAS